MSTKKLQKYSLSSPLPNISFLSKPLNLIGCHGNRKAKFEKQYSEIISSEAIRGIKLKLCRNVQNISPYNNDVSIAVAHVHVLSLLWQLLNYNRKMVNWPFFFIYFFYLFAGILTELFYKRLLSSPPSSIKIMQIPQFDLLPCQLKS